MPSLTENEVIVVVITLAIVALCIPIVLRLAGLTGQQIVDVLKQTMQFFVSLIREFRNQNKAAP